MVVYSSSKQSRVLVTYILNYEVIFLNYENCFWLENWCISSDDCCRSFSYRAKLLERAGMDSVDLLENALVDTNKWTLSFLVFKIWDKCAEINSLVQKWVTKSWFHVTGDLYGGITSAQED